MDRARIERLTEQQRTCLRYVYAHMTSKEIAPILGIEPNSVDQHLKAAMRTLGVGDRRTAARLLAEHEQREERCQPLVYQPPGLAGAADSAILDPSIRGGPQQDQRVAGERLREEQAHFHLFSPVGAPALPFRIGTTRPSDLNWVKRLAWIVAIAIGIALAFGALVSAIEALVRITRG